MNMNKEKREVEYPVELESQFILRIPEEPATQLRDVVKSGESLKNRLSIQLDNDMRHGEVRFDDWLLHAKLVDLPTIVESLKTVDRKSVYKSADICQMLICKDEIDPSSTDDESPLKNKKKDPLKVDKKFLWPHGITPPTKNVRKRRFRKTLKKKSIEAPEIEKEVKRLLRADNEAVSYTWEVIDDVVKEDDHNVKLEAVLPKVKSKKELIKNENINQSSSKVEDIFGGTLSDSDLEDEHVNVDIDSRTSYDGNYSELSVRERTTDEFNPDMLYYSEGTTRNTSQSEKLNTKQEVPSTSTSALYSVNDYCHDTDSELQQVIAELEDLKLRKQRTQHEIAGMENMTLRQRFQEILQSINKEIMLKEMKYQSLITQK